MWSQLPDQSKTRLDLSTILTLTTLTSASFPEKPLQYSGSGLEIIQEDVSVLLGPILNLGCFSFLILLLYQHLFDVEARVENL